MAPDKSKAKAKAEPNVEEIESVTGREGSTGSDTVTPTTASKPKLRSVDFLTPEQLRRKREGDRLSQKHARQRTKALVEHLQARNQDLELQNTSLAHDLAAATAALAACRCGRGHSQSHSSIGGKDDTWSVSESSALSRIDSSDAGNNNGNLEATLTQMIDGNFPGLDFTMWGGVSGFDDKTAAAAAAFQQGLFSVPYTNGLPTGPVTAPSLPSQPQPPQQQQPLPSPSPTNDAQLVHTHTHGHAHAYHTIARGQHVWSTLPPHLAATCLLDEVVINLLQSRRPLESSGGNAQEFQRRTFPSVQSLLNPALSFASTLAEADASPSSPSPASSPTASTIGPVTNTIVNKIIHVMTVPTLPEQIAILYVMSAVVRWLISPTESNYDSMPEWLRPTPSQLVEPHPPWIDLFVWPKGRERLCRQPRLHSQHALMSRLCNETISINWPHHPSDMILQTNGTEYVLNPIFDRHIKNIENWTVGKKVLQAFPEFAGDMNFK